MTTHPILDITDVDTPGAYPAITMATREGQWEALDIRLNRVSAAYGAAPSLHSIVQLEGTLHAIIRAPRTDLVRWTEIAPDSPWAWLALGMADNYEGLDARGTETADRLTDTEWRIVVQSLNRSLDLLHHALALGAQPGPAMTSIGRAATIVGVDELDDTALLQQLVERDPNWLPGWSSALARSEPRWGGSVTAMESVVAQAEAAMTNSELYYTLAAEYWWWRANWAATIEGEKQLARDHLRAGLALCPPGRMRAALLALDAQILSDIDASPEAIAIAWQAAADVMPSTPDHMFDSGLAWLKAGDVDRATDVLTRLSQMPGVEGADAANWLGRQLTRGERGFPRDPAAAKSLFHRAADQGPDGKLNLAELMLEADPTSTEGMELCRTAIDEGNGYGALPLARALLLKGDREQALAVLSSVSDDHAACKYAMARGLDEGWFGASDPSAALDICNVVLPVAFHPYLSVLFMTLCSAMGDWGTARAHGEWIRAETDKGHLAVPNELAHEVDRLIAETPGPGLGGFIKRMKANKRLRMQVEDPELWSI